eukprot:CAMPEP_0172777814 /NCGR_PEP_ID=MMETSP1074-20121228/201589_1 /TAXON_ID=2916 /ORGANISM="Ceratium fusus, Strain PA161109" /LENGTH=529 /DNA_ID=CAMNT_0013614743 /DNA_START=78 /DNA_END=1668 /DNA_ORIENTATION=-
MTMQLLSEVPEFFWAMLYFAALGALGALGYIGRFGGFMKKIATANSREIKQPKKLDGNFQPTDATANSGTQAAEQPVEGAMLPPALANCDVATTQAQAPLNPRLERLLATKATRKAHKAQRADKTVNEETEVVSANSLVLSEASTDVATEMVADAGVATPSTGDGSIMERASTVESNSAEDEPLPRAVHKEESDSESIRTDKTTPKVLGFRLQQQTSRWADQESEEEWELGKEDFRQLFNDLDEEEGHRLLGEVPNTLGNEGSYWPESEKQNPANGLFLPPCSKSNGRSCHSNGRKGCRKEAMKWQVKDGWMTPFSELLKGDASVNSLPRLQAVLPLKREEGLPKGSDEVAVKDGWMTPFSELLKGDASVNSLPRLQLAPFGPAGTESSQAELVLQTDGQPRLPPMSPMPYSTARSIQPALPTVNSTRPAVCIWKTTSPPAAMTRIGGNQQDVFTDGSQVFQPVPSTNGQKLFTDGKELYASAFVMFGTPVPSQARRPPSPEPEPEVDKQLAILMPWRKRNNAGTHRFA